MFGLCMAGTQWLGLASKNINRTKGFYMTKFYDDNEFAVTNGEFETDEELMLEEDEVEEIDILLTRSFDAHIGTRMSHVMDRFHSIY